MFAYNGAGWMVQALTPQATLVYTYNAAGLRVMQGATAYAEAQTYVWDWATAVPELLTDGRYTYLIGHDTLAWEGSATPMGLVQWAYALPMRWVLYAKRRMPPVRCLPRASGRRLAWRKVRRRRAWAIPGSGLIRG